MKLAQEICTELMIHATIEEELFYPACKGEVDDDMMAEAYVEHDGAKVMIAEILASSPDDRFFDAKVTVLSEEIKHHVKEEEAPSEGVFAQAKKAGLDMDDLGAPVAGSQAGTDGQVEERAPPAAGDQVVYWARAQAGRSS